MKAVILAGGRGTRISEESESRPKPMVEIGGRPTIWHIMKIHESAGVTDFIGLLGYKGYMIKEYFANYHLHTSDVTINLATGGVATVRSTTESWTVTLLDTGANTMTGGRLLRAKSYIGDDTFSFTYGDGVTDLDVRKLIEPPSIIGVDRYRDCRSTAGPLRRTRIRGKPSHVSGEAHWRWRLGQRRLLHLRSRHCLTTSTATTPSSSRLRCNVSRTTASSLPTGNGFWRGMDTLRDKIYRNDLWENGKAPWKIGDDQLV